MTSTADCPHDELEFTGEARMMFASESVTFMGVLIRARCADCHVQFHWRGLASGMMNPNEPCVSADGYELRAPIGPGPGAVVGLLERTGLVDKLVNPSTV